MILSLKDLFVEYSDKVILDHVDLNIDDNDKIGIIGVNGSGKSTLLRLVSNYLQLDTNQYIAKRNLTIAYLDQDTNTFEKQSMIEYVSDKSNDDATIAQAKKILNQLGLTNHDMDINKLSGGQKKRLALAHTLVQPSDLLVLDEPTNHLDALMIEWLESYLQKTNKAIIMITHDRYFLENVTNKIIELEKGTLYEYDGNYQTYLDQKAQRLIDTQAKQRKHSALLKKEKEWMMQGPKARSTKSRDRIERYEKLKEENVNIQDNNLELDSMSTRLGKKILEIKDLEVGYPDKTLINSLNYTFKNKDRIGIVGLNGSGKSTLLNTIAGLIKPLKGQLDFGSTVKIGYFSQHSDDLKESDRVINYIKDKAEFIETNDGMLSASAMLEKFLFEPNSQYNLIEKLSGGEKRRLQLLGVLMEAPNFLILDEPTNDLDIVTLTILEDYLLNFKGIILVVSHDRYFMDKIVNSLWIIQNKEITFSNEYYSNYLLQDTNEKEVKDESKKTTYVKTKKLRFSYAEQKEFETIDADMAKIEQRIEEIGQEMTLHSDNFEIINDLNNELEKLNEELELKTLRWFELNEKKEEINNQ